MAETQSNRKKVPMNEALEILGMSRGTLYLRMNAGEIKPIPKPQGLKKRGRLEFYEDELRAYKASGEVAH